VPTAELEYWRGRLAELEQRQADAVAHYSRALSADSFQPFALAARRRLTAPPLAASTAARARELAATGEPRALYVAWLLQGPGTAAGRQTRGALSTVLAGRASNRVYLDLEIAPAASWPLWQSRLDQPEQMLLALGLFSEGSGVVLRHFPIAQPGLAFTGSLALGQTGDTQRSLYVAEILKKRVPHEVPGELLPVEFRRLLFPLTYGELIRGEAARRGVDPYLLAAVIREESRFDPRAFSAAAARGLTQFIFSTAEEIAGAIELGPIKPRDLDRPEVSIALGAAYLSRLATDLPGSLPGVVAAYNAGEPQAELWRRYCLSEEEEEYLSKVAFRETRNYIWKVLTSRANYAELYSVP
jgi:soluble lytic murein transglycosylase